MTLRAIRCRAVLRGWALRPRLCRPAIALTPDVVLASLGHLEQQPQRPQLSLQLRGARSPRVCGPLFVREQETIAPEGLTNTVRSGRFGHRVSEPESRPDRLSNVPEPAGNVFARSDDLTLPSMSLA